MPRVRIIADPFDLATYEEHEVDDALALLTNKFPVWPETGRLYRDEVAIENDVTPRCQEQVDALATAGNDALFYVVVYPGDPVTALVTVVATLALTAAVLLFLTPKIPTPDNSDQSSNNSLGARVNKARPNGRVPDIFGTVTSIPELLTVPLLLFDNNLEREVCYMAVGRGSYDIAAVKDGDTPLGQIAGAAAKFYGPGTSPNSGAPFLSIGAGVPYPLMDVVKVNDVNGQILRAPNANQVSGNGDIRFVYPDQIQRNGTTIDFTKYFAPGDQLTVGGAGFGSTSPGTSTTTASMRFEQGGVIRFETFNPTTAFAVGDTVTLSNASFAGDAAAGIPVATFNSANNTYSAPGVPTLANQQTFEVVLRDDATTPSGQTTNLSAGGQNFRIVNGGGVTIPATTLRAGKIANLTLSTGGAAFVLNSTRDSGTVFLDLFGTYQVSAITSTTITLSAPASVNPDWNKLGNLPNKRTEYKASALAKPTPGSAGTNLNGTYNVVSVTAGAIVLTNPAQVNASWANVQALPGGATGYISPTLSTSGERWVGPFVVDTPEGDRAALNFVALQGMYLVTSKGKDRPRSVQVQVGLTPVNADGLATGAEQLFTTTVNGDGKDKTPRGVTLWADPTFTGRMAVRARRLTPIDLDTEDTIVDEVKWRDAYGVSNVAQPHFGNVTTVHTLTLATAGATSNKERKLNCQATRRVLLRNPDDTFGPDLVASTNAADIFCHMALDPYIGGRTVAELDVPQIYDTVAEVVEYFGIPDVGQFSYTFDQDNVSFEEMGQSVATAVFSTAYRQGSVHRLFFERQTDANDSVLLFNHRNKVPGSETRSVKFGRLNDYDGVELDYTSGDDGAKLTVYIPDDQSATKPKKIEITGVVDTRGDAAVPLLHANRAWAKILYQHTTTEFTSVGEASQLVLTQRVEVTDNTRPDVFDGEVRGQAGLVLELSQPFTPVQGVVYTIFLQLDDGGIETIPCTAGPDAMHCTLQQAPSQPLVTRDEAWALTTYQIVGTDNGRPSAFLLTEKGAYDKNTVPVQAINYDDRYYAYDATYKGD